MSRPARASLAMRVVLRRLPAALAALVAASITLAACRRGDGPEPIAYDRTPCAHCRMLISDPSFAAQLTTEDGETLDFDDPGCLLRYEAERKPRVRVAFFHHAREDRWLRAPAVAFLPGAHTPMGFGLAAVDPAEAGALGMEEAEAVVRARKDAHPGGTP